MRFRVNGGSDEAEFNSYRIARAFAVLLAQTHGTSYTITAHNANGSVLWSETVQPVVVFQPVEF